MINEERHFFHKRHLTGKGKGSISFDKLLVAPVLYVVMNFQLLLIIFIYFFLIIVIFCLFLCSWRYALLFITYLYLFALCYPTMNFCNQLWEFCVCYFFLLSFLLARTTTSSPIGSDGLILLLYFHIMH